jgi:FkbM family methyltransferase
MNHDQYRKWINDDGNNTYSLNHELNNNSIVLDVGGYHGEWSEKIYNKYHCHIYIFEPIKTFYNVISNKFKDIQNIHVFNYGISTETKTIDFSLNNDATSSYVNNKGVLVKAQVKNISEVLSELNITHVDLIKINIEGEEYPLLNYLIRENMIEMFENIMVQFHDFINDAGYMRKVIQLKLCKTHRTIFEYEFVWEKWKKLDQFLVL